MNYTNVLNVINLGGENHLLQERFSWQHLILIVTGCRDSDESFANIKVVLCWLFTVSNNLLHLDSVGIAILKRELRKLIKRYNVLACPNKGVPEIPLD